MTQISQWVPDKIGRKVSKSQLTFYWWFFEHTGHDQLNLDLHTSFHPYSVRPVPVIHLFVLQGKKCPESLARPTWKWWNTVMNYKREHIERLIKGHNFNSISELPTAEDGKWVQTHATISGHTILAIVKNFQTSILPSFW